jgi:CheY-like chemotaxis protein/two-component sensor histidine kinase
LALMRLAPGDAAVQARARAMMERQLSHLVHLVDDLLDIARIARGQVSLKREPLLLQDLVRGAVETAMPGVTAARHRLELRLLGEPLAVDADPTRLAQVVGNLLHNAVKYTPEGGHIVLALDRVEAQAVLSVHDSGVGIPPESLATVFDMFTQVDRNMARAQGGLGIGLALVRRLVELHGGSVQAESPGVGAGSCFTVRMPLLANGIALPEPLPPVAPASARRWRVLVVDDNRDAADSLAALLALEGHTVHTAYDGEAALAEAAAFQPELAFLDIGMPGRNGYEVAQALRQAPAMAGIRLVALTGWGSDADRSRSLASGFDHHLTKPADPAKLHALLLAMDGG